MEKKFWRSIVFMGLLCLNQMTFAQNLRQIISVDYNHKPLKEILDDLRVKHGIQFSYDESQIPVDKKLTVKIAIMPVHYILDEICNQSNLKWQQVSKNIVLKPLVSPVSKGKKLSQTIRGKVVDKESKEPLIGVSVSVLLTEPMKTGVTDQNGEFRLDDVAIGRQDLAFSYMGFEKLILQQLLVGSVKELVLTVEMVEKYNSLGEVVVSAGINREAPLNEMAMISARSFTVEETSRYAAGNFDPARMAQNFAGVTIGDDVGNEIVIRGNSPKGLLWRLEGIEISNPNHFGEEGSSAGGISMISSNVLSTSDFYTGAFPAEYGNALSGVFDLQFRKGNSEKREHAFMLGILGTEFSMEGPFSKQSGASYLFNYRYSTLALLEKIGVNPAGDNPTPKYQDLAFNIHMPTKKSGSFSLFGILGYSYQHGIAEKDSLKWDSYQDKFNRRNSYTSASMGIKHLTMINSRTYLKNIISASYSNIIDNADTLDTDYQLNIYGRDRFNNSAFRYSGLLNYKVSNNSTIRTGLMASLINFDFKSMSYKKNLGKLSEYIDEKQSTYLLEGYGQWKYQMNEKLNLNTGVHISYFGLSNDISIEPRVGLGYLHNSKNSFNLALGIHSRIEPLALYYGKNELADGSVNTTNENLRTTKALHLIAGYQHSFTNNLKLKLETYYQYLYDVPITTDPAVNFSALNMRDAYFIYSRNYGELSNKGKGRNYGIEITLERMFANSYYFLLTSSVYKSDFANIRNQYFPTVFSGDFSTNFLFGKEVKVGRKNVLAFNGKVLLNGGRRYSPLNTQESIKNDYPVYYEEQVNSLQAPVYSRIDMSLRYRVDNPKITHTLYLDVQNVLNKSNVREIYYNGDKKEIDTLLYTGIIPTINYKIEF